MSQVCYSFWVLSALSILNKLHWINAEKLTEFILSAQVRSLSPLYSYTDYPRTLNPCADQGEKGPRPRRHRRPSRKPHRRLPHVFRARGALAPRLPGAGGFGPGVLPPCTCDGEDGVEECVEGVAEKGCLICDDGWRGAEEGGY